MGRKKKTENDPEPIAPIPFTDEEENEIVYVTDILLSVGATWDQVKMELFRVSIKKDSAFKRIPTQSTLELMLKRKLGYDSIIEYKENRKDDIKIALKNKAVTMALAGNPAMLIFCLKNICGWSDNVQQVPDPDTAKNMIRLAYDRNAI
jgi:hypothetical protein